MVRRLFRPGPPASQPMTRLAANKISIPATPASGISASMRNWLPKMSAATVRFSTLLTCPSKVSRRSASCGRRCLNKSPRSSGSNCVASRVPSISIKSMSGASPPEAHGSRTCRSAGEIIVDVPAKITIRPTARGTFARSDSRKRRAVSRSGADRENEKTCGHHWTGVEQHEQGDGHARKHQIVRHRGARDQLRILGSLGELGECHPQSDKHHHLNECDRDQDVDHSIKGHVTSSVKRAWLAVIATCRDVFRRRSIKRPPQLSGGRSAGGPAAMPFCGGALSGARCPPAAAAWHGGYRWVNSATSFIDSTRRYQFTAASLLAIEIAGASSAPVLSLPILAVVLRGRILMRFLPFITTSFNSRLGFSNRPCRSTPSCRRFPLDQALSSFGVGPRFLCHQFS